MLILHSLLSELKEEFARSRKGEERSAWFLHTLLAIILPFTSSKTSNLLRALRTLFGFTDLAKKRYYTFMASPKIPWDRLWPRLWKMIPEPETNGRLIVALDDYINPKTGKKIFACAKVFDHAAKQNQSPYPWAQNIVAIGLLKVIKGRWACLPLCQRYYFLEKEIAKNKPTYRGKEIVFQSKHGQAVDMLGSVAAEFPQSDILVVSDSWFGNDGLWTPVRKELGGRVQMLSRLRANNNLFGLPEAPTGKGAGRPRKYGDRLGTTSTLASVKKGQAREYTVNLYGRMRTVLASDQIVMLKTLKRPIKVVWVYRRTRWVAMFSTDLTLSIAEIIEYYGAKVEDRGRFQRTEAGYRQCRYPEQKSCGGKKPPGLLPDGHFAHLDLRLSPGENAMSTACGQRPQPFRLFRRPKVSGPSSIGQEFCSTLPRSTQIGG